jgi:hypothetical protein
MRNPMVLDWIVNVGPAAEVSGTEALDLDADGCVTLQFGFGAGDEMAIEAIRHARRAMLREEWTRGRDAGEPSLEAAVFSAGGVVWTVRPEQRDWCLRKLEELVARATRTLEALEAGRA